MNSLELPAPDQVPRSIQTDRLLMRHWTESDLEPFAAMNRDERVMEFFPALLTADETQQTYERICAHFQNHGFGFWAVEIPGVEPFIGFVGLSIPRFEAPFTPCVEIGWRLIPEFWGKGFATESAQAALHFGFDSLGLHEILSFASAPNRRSRRVMERIGMTHDPVNDFDHPLLPDGHALQRQALYRCSRPTG